MSLTGGDRALFLRASRDIEFVKEHGRRSSTAYFNMLVCRGDTAVTRVGIVVGKRFGIAVRRNRAKRLFRTLTRLFRPDLAAGYTVLVFPKRDALSIPLEELKRLWRSALERQGVLRAHVG